MVRVLQRTRDFLQTLPATDAPLLKLQALVRWAMQVQLAGEMPSLPSQNSSLRANLMGNNAYLDVLVQVSDQLGGWIQAAQTAGQINPQLPAVAVLYTLYARACDPVLGFLQAGGQHSDEQIIEWVLSTCFDGLIAR
jgi:hypothetical protein